jgi:hypothetical protein
MGQTCSVYVRDEKCIKILVKSLLPIRFYIIQMEYGLLSKYYLVL